MGRTRDRTEQAANHSKRRLCTTTGFFLLASLVLLSAATIPASAQNARPEVPVHRILPERAPSLDGILNDPVWTEATPAGDFRQYDPEIGEPMTERTAFRILCDGQTLFLGVDCFDREPDQIVRRKMLRDGNIFSDDYIYFAIDTFLDRRNAYVFSVNPNGTRYDALGTDNISVDNNWDGVWTARTSIDAQGWHAEIAIPLHTLSFDPATDRWGFNMSRMVRRKNERGRWHRALPNLRTSMMSEAGNATGLGGLRPGLGLQLSPYVTGRYRHRAASDERSSDDSWLGDLGADLRYRFTPSLNGTLSINTDFAETEVDQRQLNFGRFPLFFPEKRDFFLEDQSSFQFNKLYDRNHGYRTGVLPFFSRRIGRDADGNAEPIRLAAKLTGRAGAWNLGVLDAWTGAEEDGGERNLFVGRASRQIGEASSAGVILTAGDPLGRASRSREVGTIGVDARFRNADAFGGQLVEGAAFALASYDGAPLSEEESDDEERAPAGAQADEAFGALLSFPNDLFYASAKFLQVGENFDPALGFVRRQGIRGYATNFSYEPRPKSIGWLRQYKTSLVSETTTDLDNHLESADYSFWPLQIDFESGEEISFRVDREFDAPAEDFSLFDTINVPAGDYWWTDYRIGLESARKHAVVGEFDFSWGDFYNGRRTGVDVEANVALSKHFNLDFDYSWDRLSFDANEADGKDTELDVHRAALRGVVNWTPDLSLINFAQYDTASENLGWQSRLQWEYRAGQSFYAVFNQGFRRDAGSFESEDTEAVLKFGSAWWF